MKGLNSYSSEAKTRWRKWEWSQLSGPENFDRTVVYLCGPDDEDRREGMIHGYANSNLIAVDIVEDRIQDVRDNGGIGISGDLGDLILLWPEKWKIDVVIADFCGGMVRSAALFIEALRWSRAIHPGTLVAANFLRGRDAWSNAFRDSVRRNVSGISADAKEYITRKTEGRRDIPILKALAIEEWRRHEFYEKPTNVVFTDCLHRGKQFLAFVSAAKSRLVPSASAGIDTRHWLDFSRFATFSYKSGSQVFDSVVFRCGMMPFSMMVNSDKNANLEACYASRSMNATRRRLAALSAVRTIKKKAST